MLCRPQPQITGNNTTAVSSTTKRRGMGQKKNTPKPPLKAKQRKCSDDDEGKIEKGL
jgi:hypothetical protein